MQDKLERLLKLVYRKWKADYLKPQREHPDEEALVCFLEKRFPPAEAEQIKRHLISCQSCAERFATQLRLRLTDIREIPQELIATAKDLVQSEEKTDLLEIFLRLKEKTIELLNVTGCVLLGQELIPAPLLRSRSIKDFKDEVNILKDFKDVRVEVKIEHRSAAVFDLTVMVKEKVSRRIMKDLRITLIKEGLELESYISSLGKVSFEHVQLGKYTIEITDIEDKLATILLDIKM